MEILVCLLVTATALFAKPHKKQYECTECGYIHDDAIEKALFKNLSSDWECPICGAEKEEFKQL